uniref:Protein kinase domain-containing protein n=2 Tax=Opuntia streptacantha TaxID=393608 RepID=A0A7C9CEZ0_OPUST
MGLQELNLSHNNLSGEIPMFLVKFQLQKLDLSDNDLEGEVPFGGIFSNASGLSISGNRKLCGGIPILKLPQCIFSEGRKRKLGEKTKVIISVLSLFSGAALLVAFASLYALYYKKGKETAVVGSQDIENSLSNLSYQRILKATDGFSSENLIGSGNFGVVYKGTFDEGRTTVAIKKFSLEHKEASKSFMVECEVLRNVRHRNLVKVITACSGTDYQGNDFKALVYEYMVNGSLEDWLHAQPFGTVEGTSSAPKNLNLLRRLNIAVDVAFALGASSSQF